MTLAITSQKVGNASGQFAYGFAYDQALPTSQQTYYVAHVSVDTTFVPIDPAKDETVQAAVTALQAIEAATATISAAAVQTSVATTSAKNALANSGACTMTQTIVTLAQGQSYTIAANPARKSLRLMVVDVGNVVMAVGTNPPANGLQGVVYDGAAVSGTQGGSDAFDGPSVPTNAFTMLALNAATTVVVWEGA